MGRKSGSTLHKTTTRTVDPRLEQQLHPSKSDVIVSNRCKQTLSRLAEQAVMLVIDLASVQVACALH